MRAAYADRQHAGMVSASIATGWLEGLLQAGDARLYILLFLFALGESGLFVGLVIPGESALIVAGAGIAFGRLDLGWVVAAVCLGAVLGDSLSFGLGRRYGKRLLDSRAGRRVGLERWDRARTHFEANGARAVFFGRFVGVLRALVPAVAGWAGMRYRSFVSVDVPAALLWATGSVLVGVAAGESWRVAERWLGWTGLGLVAAAAVALAALLIAKRTTRSRAAAGRR